MRALAVLLVALLASIGRGEGETLIAIVRHAEKASGSGDVPLSEGGLARSRDLAKLGEVLQIRAAYCTPTQRARQTAEALLEGTSVSTYDQPTRAWMKQVVAAHAGGAVLIVGHSNTVPAMVKLLSGKDIVLGEADFDRLYLIRVKPEAEEGTASIIELRYGKQE